MRTWQELAKQVQSWIDSPRPWENKGNVYALDRYDWEIVLAALKELSERDAPPKVPEGFKGSKLFETRPDQAQAAPESGQAEVLRNSAQSNAINTQSEAERLAARVGVLEAKVAELQAPKRKGTKCPASIAGSHFFFFGNKCQSCGEEL